MQAEIRKERLKMALIYPPHKVESLMFSLAYLSGYLKSTDLNLEIDIIDCPANNYDIEKLESLLGSIEPNIVGISIPFSNMLSSALRCMRMVREKFPQAWIITGGTHSTLCPEDVCNECDIAVKGAGEKTMENLVKCFPDKNKAYSLKNIAYCDDSKLCINETDYKSNITKMPVPDWSGVKMIDHLEPVIYGNPRHGIGILGSRGCPYNCTYCSNGLLSARKVIFREVDEILKEIKWMIESYDIRSFKFRDEVFNLNRKRVIEFCKKIKDEKIDIEWSFQTRCDMVKNKDIFSLMIEAGARAVSLGIESGNDSILKANKSISKESISNAVSILKEAGLLVYAGFIIGFPQDTIETVWETIRYPDLLNIDSPGFQIMVPYPKTLVHFEAERTGVIRAKNYDDYTTYGVVYVPPGLEGYDLLAIRKFAFQYFHTRSKDRVAKWLNRFVDRSDYPEIEKKYWSLYDKKETLNFEYLCKLKENNNSESVRQIEKLPI